MKDDFYEIEIGSLNYGDRFQLAGTEYILLNDFGRYRYAITANIETEANAETYDIAMNKFKAKMNKMIPGGVVAVSEIAEYLKNLYPYEFGNVMKMLCRQKLNPWWIGKESQYMTYVSDGNIRIIRESDNVVRGIRPMVLFAPTVNVLYEYNV